MYKSCKVRLYPTKEQRESIWRHIGACRFIWNYMLHLQQENFKSGDKLISASKMTILLPEMKKTETYSWMNNISAASLQRECSNLQYAYEQFFKKNAGYPKFKTKKKSRPAYPVAYQPFRFEENYVTVAKLGKVKYKSDFNFLQNPETKYSNMQIEYENEKYFLSFSYACETQVRELTDKPMGIDVGIKTLATAAFSDKQISYPNINKSKKMKKLEEKAKRLQRSISRKYEISRKGTTDYVKTNNIRKEETKLRKTLVRMTNIRRNYIHQTTHELIEKLPCVVTMETLDVSRMLKNKHIRKDIGETSMKKFLNTMKYKCEENGIQFVQVDRYYPSSKTCSNCGTIKPNLKLSDRVYICPDCGLKIDRDFNAAINLMMYGAHQKEFRL